MTHLGIIWPYLNATDVFLKYMSNTNLNPNSIKSHSFTIRYTLETFPEEDIAKFLILLVDAGSFSGATKGI